MSDIILSSYAESEAEKAESLKAFSGFKLLHVKRQLSLILGQIGKGEIFDEYTKHDISHINYMLKSLDWIIPEDTKKIMTPGDWLMITLAIYFHDLGMLVTNEEYKQRNESEFVDFKANVQDGNYGLDYKNKVLGLDTEKQDRFLYQEYVRKTHAERIKYWILNKSSLKFPPDLSITNEIRDLLKNIDDLFLKDLANVCESHHLIDLDDTEKYKIKQQYGPTEEEIVNIQYSAILLRTADLLHITSDRTPSIEFSLINPTDPVSQEEWAKQNAVKAVAPVDKTNKEGNVDHSLKKDTFGIIAHFKEEKGFFGLISYLNYADSQLKESFKFNEASKVKFSHKYDFAWRNIDDSSIETENFEKRQFEFTLDQNKILDLLVGHTLYNDYTVVLRELIQNSIDASKLKKHELEINPKNTYSPHIKVEWSEESRELTFTDNGTGMTIEIIENHLLKVGSSRYQDPTFKKNNPDFSPISRFGIGLLTCFLIADDIDILTKSEEQQAGIMLKIRKVHGKYLLKYIDGGDINSRIGKHGTEIKLYVRSDVGLENIKQEIEKWILLPQCQLTLIDKGIDYNIGYKSPKQILENSLSMLRLENNDNIKIHEVTENDITLAYGLRYVEHLKEWTYLEINQNITNLPIGICIEGIRVDFASPGLNNQHLFALANTSGKRAPKTNVARSNIELTPERTKLLQDIYRLYLTHITTEIQNLATRFSITWAAAEAGYLLSSFMQRGYRYDQENSLADYDSFIGALKNLKLILIEKDKVRQLVSINDLIAEEKFWIIESVAYNSANSLIKEVKASNSSITSLIDTVYGPDVSDLSHIDNLMCSQIYDQNLMKLMLDNFQVDKIKINTEQRRLDLRWSNKDLKIWDKYFIERSYERKIIFYLQIKEHNLDQEISQSAIKSTHGIFIPFESELNIFLRETLANFDINNREDKISIKVIFQIINHLLSSKDFQPSLEDTIELHFERDNSSSSRNDAKILWSKIDKQEFLDKISKIDFSTYDTSLWTRRNIDYFY